MTRTLALLAAAALTMLAACSSGGDPAPTSSTTSASATTAAAPTSTGPVERRFGTVVELRDAVVAAGHACPTWVQDNVVSLAAESGHCAEDDVLSTYATQGALEQAVSNMKGMNGMFTDPAAKTPILVGPNWIYNAKDAGQVQAALGGTIVR